MISPGIKAKCRDKKLTNDGTLIPLNWWTTLHELVVEPTLDSQGMWARYLLCDHKPQTKRTKGIQRFSPHNPTITELKIPRVQIIGGYD